MRDRGLPIVDGAPACPFVAFEDDRDARSGVADHRHRCFAEVRAAPRALAHQEAFCLSSSFPACPTFQDWARREAASIDAAREDGDSASVADGASQSAGARSAPQEPFDPNRRNPPRDWAAPPPWLAGSRSSGRTGRTDPGAPIRGALDDDADEGPLSPPPGGGLSGSFADRIVSGAGDPFTDRPPVAGRAPATPPSSMPDDEPVDDADPDDAGPTGPGATPSRSSIPRHLGPGTAERPRQPARDGVARRTADPAAPPWERPRRLEAYPTIRSRRLPSLGGSSVLIGFVAVLLAAAALFFLPGILGLGNETPDPTATPSASASPTAVAASPSLVPTDEPLPTGDVYIVEPGDTMSKIANKFGIPLGLLIEANKETIPDPDALQIGDEVIIPALPPTSIPGASPSAPGSAAP